MDAFLPRPGPLEEVGGPAQAHHGPGQGRQVAREGREIPQAELLLQHQMAAEAHQHQGGQAADEHGHGAVGREKGRLADRKAGLASAEVPEPLDAGLLQPEGLHHLLAADGFVAVGVEFRAHHLELLLDAVAPAAQQVETQGQEEKGRHHRGREGGVGVDHQAHGHGEDRERLEEAHQPRARGHANGADVIAHAAHEVAHPLPLVEREGLAQQEVEQLLPLQALDGAAQADEGVAHQVAAHACHRREAQHPDQHAVAFGPGAALQGRHRPARPPGHPGRGQAADHCGAQSQRQGAPMGRQQGPPPQAAQGSRPFRHAPSLTRSPWGMLGARIPDRSCHAALRRPCAGLRTARRPGGGGILFCGPRPPGLHPGRWHEPGTAPGPCRRCPGGSGCRRKARAPAGPGLGNPRRGTVLSPADRCHVRRGRPRASPGCGLDVPAPPEG
ncbi:MAG: hypothetical protein BWY56_02462 [Acidobacteria bacterium ADurb.Bin340]|nr:MAG: hypothetical protein BWY56_02462 [Acidobacteria bacterium ADurb.Bin340]